MIYVFFFCFFFFFKQKTAYEMVGSDWSSDVCSSDLVLSDVLEHVDPPARADVLREALRVTRKLAVFGFPCGAEALRVDRSLYEEYRRRSWSPPRWLEEHLRNGLPDE